MYPNPSFIKCIEKIENGYKVLNSLEIIYEGDFKFNNIDTVYYYKPKAKKFDYVAAFDLDWTLSYNEKHLFPKEVDDIKIFPNRRKLLEDIIKLGYTIVIFTNQAGVKMKKTLITGITENEFLISSKNPEDKRIREVKINPTFLKIIFEE